MDCDISVPKFLRLYVENDEKLSELISRFNKNNEAAGEGGKNSSNKFPMSAKIYLNMR